MKKIINKLYSFLFSARTKTSHKNNIKVDYDKSKLNEKIKSFLAYNETKSAPYDYQQVLSSLYNQDSINFKKAVDNKEETLNEREKLDKILQKSKEEEDKINSFFINNYSFEILENSTLLMTF